MRFIPKEELIQLISHCYDGNISQDDIDKLFYLYGDVYYIVGGSWGYWEKCNENVERQVLLAQIKDDGNNTKIN